MRFPKRIRLRRSADFHRVFRAGRRVRSRLCEMLWLPQADSVQLGLIAARTSGNAVVRNRLKRVTREWFRAQQLSLASGHWVVRFFAAAGTVSAAKFRDDLTRLAQSVTKRPCKS